MMQFKCIYKVAVLTQARRCISVPDLVSPAKLSNLLFDQHMNCIFPSTTVNQRTIRELPFCNKCDHAPLMYATITFFVCFICSPVSR